MHTKIRVNQQIFLYWPLNDIVCFIPLVVKCLVVKRARIEKPLMTLVMNLVFILPYNILYKQTTLQDFTAFFPLNVYSQNGFHLVLAIESNQLFYRCLKPII